MPIKRNPFRSPKPRAPRKRRATRVASNEPPPLRGRLVSEEEKRELILAHAAMRKSTDPVQLMSVWAGVLVAFVVIAGGWYWAYAPTALKPTGTFELKGMATQLMDFGQSAKDIANAAGSLASTSTSEEMVTSTREDLFKPATTSTTPTTTHATTSTH